MNIFFGCLFAMVWMATTSNCFTLGIRPIHSREMSINTHQPTPASKDISKTKTKDQRGIESVISMFIEMQQIIDMLNP